MATSSPFDRLRTRLQLTPIQFAEVLGQPLTTVHGALRGLTAIPRKAYDALRELGEDPEQLAIAQATWIAEHSRRLRAELNAGRATQGAEQ